MNWTSLLSTQRFCVNKQNKVVPKQEKEKDKLETPTRSPFHIDHDRVVFSSAFRRLGRKTQVHPLAMNDHTHNRLTHSVEVASVGRSFGNQVGEQLRKQGVLPDGLTPVDVGDVVQVACLAHDIGNPPFGHSGEDALRDWFLPSDKQIYLKKLMPAQRLDVMTYEGNAHTLRVLASLAIYAEKGGMRLTAATLGTVVKYPWTSELIKSKGKDKFNIYQTEQAYFTKVADELGLIRRNDNEWARHPLSYLMEAADDICYAILDLEDAVEIGILDFSEMEKVLSTMAGWDKNTHSHLNVQQKSAALSAISINKCVIEVTQKFMDNLSLLMLGEFSAKAEDLLSVCSVDITEALKSAKELARRKIYHHRSNLSTKLATFPCLASLLDVFIPMAHNNLTGDKKKGKEMQRVELLRMLLSDASVNINKGDSLYIGYMKVLDYIGSLTDNSAAKLARELSGVGIR